MASIHDLDVDDYLYACVSIERTDISAEFARVASDMAYWGEHYAQAERGHAEAKSELDRVQAKQYLVIRSRLEDKGKVTETMVNSTVLGTEKYREAKDNLIDCGAALVRAKQIIEAVKTKREMLVSLGAQMRAEMRGEPYIRDDDKDIEWGFKKENEK